MACPQSPEAGYHRFKLEPRGLEFDTVCVYCGAQKTLHPFAEQASLVYRRSIALAPSAAKRGVQGL